jgi:purine-nucleoside phosphorylase
MSTTYRSSALLLCAGLIGACGKTLPPECDNPLTLQAVQTDLLARTHPAGRFSADEIKTQLQIDAPVVLALDEARKVYRCRARLSAGGTYSFDFFYESALDRDGKSSASVIDMEVADLYEVKAAFLDGVKRSRRTP